MLISIVACLSLFNAIFHSRRISKKRKYFFPKMGRFSGFYSYFVPDRLIRFTTTNNSKPKKSIGYEHIEKAIWWAKNY